MTSRAVLEKAFACVGDGVNPPVPDASAPDASADASADTSPQNDGGDAATPCRAISRWAGNQSTDDDLGTNPLTVAIEGGTAGYGSGKYGFAFSFSSKVPLQQDAPAGVAGLSGWTVAQDDASRPLHLRRAPRAPRHQASSGSLLPVDADRLFAAIVDAVRGVVFDSSYPALPYRPGLVTERWPLDESGEVLGFRTTVVDV